MPLVCFIAEFPTEEGTRLSPGLSLSSIVAVPALSIPDTAVNLMVVSASGEVQNIQFNVSYGNCALMLLWHGVTATS